MACNVYDAAGNRVGRFDAGTRSAGAHTLSWNAAGLKPGIYFCELDAAGRTSTFRLVKSR